jgi:four helix bundle protein
MPSGVTRFEDLVAWQRARALSGAVYKATSSRPFSADFALRDQMRRAAVSGMSNIAEGFERSRPAEFHQFLSMAKGSCAELRSQLYVALDAGHLSKEAFDALLLQAEEVGRLVGGLRASIDRRRGVS